MKHFFALYIAFLLTFFVPNIAHADEVAKLGMHVLQPDEFAVAKQALLSPDTTAAESAWNFMTVPITLVDIEDPIRWQKQFDQAKIDRVIPIVRLTTRFENNAWQRPNRKEIVALINFLSDLEWPTADKRIIVFNEVNHAKEWGGSIDPASYAQDFIFASNWAHAVDPAFIVLPAAMDLAAGNTKDTSEAFWYLSQLYEYDPEVFSYADAWNSHSYPNPGFVSSPVRTDKNSLRGFEHELAFLENKIDKSLPVYITETGWRGTRATDRWLASYYEYALRHIWSKPEVVAVTPFLYKGAPGPFAEFSFVTADDQPTNQLLSLQLALENIAREKRLLSSVQ
ncbi:MAG: hypothetical protein GW946_00425 [Candidatus Pacebacteria bacterium]|nr:hypothetical protein [Candidatus Paceibacterota bacterium]PIR60159.1 MAG: hypothetical protein COU67_03160 [Candidatus Pacebacteria bacterium CG10_big_fil_rev_8_21_14_0_10_44_54]